MIENFYRNNRERQIKFVRRILYEDPCSAEDVVQEAYYRAIRYYTTFEKHGGPLDKWFTSILFNCINDKLKENKNRQEGVNGIKILREVSDIKFILDNKENIEKEISLIKKPDHRQILNAFYIKGYTSKEIRETIGYNLTKIRKVCSLFHKHLKERFNVDA